MPAVNSVWLSSDVRRFRLVGSIILMRLLRKRCPQLALLNHTSNGDKPYSGLCTVLASRHHYQSECTCRLDKVAKTFLNVSSTIFTTFIYVDRKICNNPLTLYTPKDIDNRSEFRIK